MTPDQLLDLSAHLEALFEEDRDDEFDMGDLIYVGFQPTQWGGADNYRLYHEAEACARWMEYMKIEEAPVVGPFVDKGVEHEFARGDRVRIVTGARVFSMHPQVPREGTIRKRSQVVTIDRTSWGFVDLMESLRRDVPILHGPCVVWAGAGGYWCETGIENVELVERAAAAA